MSDGLNDDAIDDVTFEEIPEPELPPPPANVTPALQLKNVSKFFGSVLALRDISLHVDPGTVTCVLGDNGAGKSTLIKILSGVHQPTEGELLVDGEPSSFSSPREALGAGIATVFQDLATVPLMSVWRNFFLGNEPRRGLWPLQVLDTRTAKRVCREELLAMGIDIRDLEQPVGTLSGGERQAVAISRAVYFGAKVLILDEPTSALGVRQSGVVLKYILQARERGIAVVFITHNPHHAHMVGDRFYLLNRGQMTNEFERKTVTREDLVKAMSGGAELEALAHELEGSAVR
jgi:simple sugar transport system ATP-binding protein